MPVDDVHRRRRFPHHDIAGPSPKPTMLVHCRHLLSQRGTFGAIPLGVLPLDLQHQRLAGPVAHKEIWDDPTGRSESMIPAEVST